METLENKAGYLYSSLHNEPRYGAAKELYQSINLGDPDRDAISYLYGDKLQKIILKHIDHFYHSNPFKGKLRKHNLDAPTIISDTRDELSDDMNFVQSQSLLSNKVVPSKGLFESIYGKYSEAMINNYHEFITRNKMRKGKLPYVVHPHRVAALSSHMTKKEGLGRKESVASAVCTGFHDTPEELCKDLVTYDAFLQRWIPEEFIPDTKILTNPYMMILNAIDDYCEKTNKTPTYDFMIDYLEKQYELSHSDLSHNISSLLQFIEYNEDKFKLNTRMTEELMDPSYVLYGRDFFSNPKKTHLNRRIKIKFRDLSDNAHGSDDLDLKGRLSNINKMQHFCNICNEHNPSEDIRKYIDEVQEDALNNAEDLIISKLVRVQSPIDHFVSALNTRLELYPVIYENYKKQNYRF